MGAMDKWMMDVAVRLDKAHKAIIAITIIQAIVITVLVIHLLWKG